MAAHPRGIRSASRRRLARHLPAARGHARAVARLPETGSCTRPRQVLAIAAVPVLLLPTVIAHELAHVVVARRRGHRGARGRPAPGGHAARRRPTQAGDPGDGSAGRARWAAGERVPRCRSRWRLALVAEREGRRRLADSHAAGHLPWRSATCSSRASSLYPGAPMDGGQLVHAIVRHVSHDPATGRGGPSAVGVIGGLAGDDLRAHRGGHAVDATAGLWLTLLGWSLGRASRMARSQDRLMQLITGLDVGDAIQRDVAVIVADADARHPVRPASTASAVPGCYPVQRGTTSWASSISGTWAGPGEAPDRAAGERPDAPAGLGPLGAPGPAPVGRGGLIEQGRMGAVPVVDLAEPPALLGLRDTQLGGPAAAQPRASRRRARSVSARRAARCWRLEDALARMLVGRRATARGGDVGRRRARARARRGRARPRTRCRPGTTPRWTATR